MMQLKFSSEGKKKSHSPFKKIETGGKELRRRFCTAHSLSPTCLESKKWGITGSEATLDPGSSLFPFLFETTGEGILLHYIISVREGPGECSRLEH